MSQLEDAFAMHWARFGSGEKPVRQFQFDPTRKWLADFAWPDAGLIVEIQGGQWVRGRHNRGGGYQADLERLNAAVLLGWSVLQYTGDDLTKRPVQVIEEVREMLNRKAVRYGGTTTVPISGPARDSSGA